MKNWISFPRVEGTASRQAHCDLPDGTYEREAGREGGLWRGRGHRSDTTAQAGDHSRGHPGIPDARPR